MNIPLSSCHTGGIHGLLADGSVRFISASVPLDALQWLCSKAGGEVLPDF
jgi:hypothetical protein